VQLININETIKSTIKIEIELFFMTVLFLRADIIYS
jgi:hypothetical protein